MKRIRSVPLDLSMWSTSTACTDVLWTKFVAILVVVVVAVSSRTFHLGVMMPYTGRWSVGRSIAGAITAAVERANADQSLKGFRRGDHVVTFSWKDAGCREAIGLKVLVDLWMDQEHPVDVFIGKSVGISGVCLRARLPSVRINFGVLRQD